MYNNYWNKQIKRDLASEEVNMSVRYFGNNFFINSIIAVSPSHQQVHNNIQHSMHDITIMHTLPDIMSDSCSINTNYHTNEGKCTLGQWQVALCVCLHNINPSLV